MDTFWGCETEELTTLSADVGTRAARLQALIDQAAGSVRTVSWIGPDADRCRQQMEELVSFVIELIEKLRELGELLREEAAQQDLCSAAEGPWQENPLWGVRAAPPWWPGGDPDVIPPILAPSGSEDRRPTIGGPFMAEDAPWLEELVPKLEALWPRILGPVIPTGLPWAQAGRPLPEGEDFALDPETVQAAEDLRTRALRAVPYARSLQMMLRAQGAVEGGFDQAEMALEQHGLGAFTPLVSLARTPFDLTGAALGENSGLGQVATAVDDGVANVLQTGDEVLTALGEGDVGGALRAGERGFFRQGGVLADVLTASSGPAYADTASDLIGTGADLLEPLDPGTAQDLRTLEGRFENLEQRWMEGREQITDPEFYYDLRRTYAPAPWDPQG